MANRKKKGGNPNYPSYRNWDYGDLQNNTYGFRDTNFNNGYNQRRESSYDDQRSNINDYMYRRDRRNQSDYGNRYDSSTGDREYQSGYENQHLHDRDGNRRNRTGNFNSNWQREDWGRTNVNAGMINNPDRDRPGYGGYPGRDYGYGTFNSDNDYPNQQEQNVARNRYGGDTSNYGNANQGGFDRDWWDKTRDEVSSWFGDEDADRRREMDYRMNSGSNYRGRGPKDYNRSEDRIREDVCDRLTDDTWLDASEVQVEVKGKDVILSGTVNNRNQKRRAEDLVESISGVKNVENRIRIGNPDEHRQDKKDNPNSTWKE